MTRYVLHALQKYLLKSTSFLIICVAQVGMAISIVNHCLKVDILLIVILLSIVQKLHSVILSFVVISLSMGPSTLFTCTSHFVNLLNLLN